MKSTITVTFTCDGCEDTYTSQDNYATLPMGWRELTWRGGYQGDEKREAHYCSRCRIPYLAAIDLMMKRK